MKLPESSTKPVWHEPVAVSSGAPRLRLRLAVWAKIAGATLRALAKHFDFGAAVKAVAIDAAVHRNRTFANLATTAGRALILIVRLVARTQFAHDGRWPIHIGNIASHHARDRRHQGNQRRIGNVLNMGSWMKLRCKQAFTFVHIADASDDGLVEQRNANCFGSMEL